MMKFHGVEGFMNNLDSRKISGEKLIRWAFLGVLVFICGCGDFFDKKGTELQTKEILSELEQIRQIPEVTNTLPNSVSSESTNDRAIFRKRVSLVMRCSTISHCSVGRLAMIAR